MPEYAARLLARGLNEPGVAHLKIAALVLALAAALAHSCGGKAPVSEGVAHFSSSDPGIDQIWAASVRTARDMLAPGPLKTDAEGRAVRDRPARRAARRDQARPVPVCRRPGRQRLDPAALDAVGGAGPPQHDPLVRTRPAPGRSDPVEPRAWRLRRPRRLQRLLGRGRLRLRALHRRSRARKGGVARARAADGRLVPAADRPLRALRQQRRQRRLRQHPASRARRSPTTTPAMSVRSPSPPSSRAGSASRIGSRPGRPGSSRSRPPSGRRSGTPRPAPSGTRPPDRSSIPRTGTPSRSSRASRRSARRDRRSHTSRRTTGSPTAPRSPTTTSGTASRGATNADLRVYPFISYYELLARYQIGLDDSAITLIRREWGYMLANGPRSTMWETIGPVRQRPGEPQAVLRPRLVERRRARADELRARGHARLPRLRVVPRRAPPGGPAMGARHRADPARADRVPVGLRAAVRSRPRLSRRCRARSPSRQTARPRSTASRFRSSSA